MATHHGRTTKSKRYRIEQFLKSPEAETVTRIEIARRFGVVPMYVTRIASLMGAAREYKLSKKRPRPDILASIGKDTSSKNVLPKGPEALRPTVTEREIEAIKDSNTLSTQEQREHLSWLALNATRDEARVAAHRALQQLDQSLGVQTKLGPGEPLTKEGRVFRLSLLMEACGKDTTLEAMNRAFGGAEEGNAASSGTTVLEAPSGPAVTDGGSDALADVDPLPEVSASGEADKPKPQTVVLADALLPSPPVPKPPIEGREEPLRPPDVALHAAVSVVEE